VEAAGVDMMRTVASSCSNERSRIAFWTRSPPVVVFVVVV
jgi:hypothetical protein